MKKEYQWIPKYWSKNLRTFTKVAASATGMVMEVKAQSSNVVQPATQTLNSVSKTVLKKCTLEWFEFKSNSFESL